MWTQILNQSRSERKFGNKPLIILGNKHSGKRSLIDSLFDISKTTLHNKRLTTLTETNKMRLKGLTTAIDYAYLNVIDLNDPDYRTHTKFEIYMIEDIEHPKIYSELAKPQILKDALIVIMLDFTSPWNFMIQLEKWAKFILQLQQMAGLSIGQLEEMAKKQQNYYKSFKQPQFDQNGRPKARLPFNTEQDESLALPIPEGVLSHNLRIPFLVCVNKSDLQGQVLRDESANKLILILYHLRNFCVQYGGSLVYTSIRNNSNLNVMYEYLLHRCFNMPLRFKTQAINEEAIFIPFGYDNPTLIKDSVVKIDVQKSFTQAIPAPINKKVVREEITVEQDSQYFKKHINTTSSTQQSGISTTSAASSQKQIEGNAPSGKAAQVTIFFKNLLSGNTKKQGKSDNMSRISGQPKTAEQTQRFLNAEKDLLKHTTQVIQKPTQQEPPSS